MPDRLRTRPEFLAVARGRRYHAPLFTLQVLRSDEPRAPRVGITVTKKVGGATERNRIRRRLREALRHGRPPDGAELGAPGADYVLIARREVLMASFRTLCEDLARAFDKAAGADGAGARRAPPPHTPGQSRSSSAPAH